MPSSRVLAAIAVLMSPFFLAAPSKAEPSGGPTVVELFTSQGCYSCPPAEAYLRELAVRRDIVALEWHVDYWDDLVYGLAGRWKGPFSSPEATQRQRTYNVNLRGSPNVYTPQMVMAGRYEAVGSRRGSVQSAIIRNRRQTPSKIEVAVTPGAGTGLSVRINGVDDRPGSIWLVRFDREHTTPVRAGENKGKTLVSRNIVRDMQLIGAWDGTATEVALPAPNLSQNQGCAVLVQNDRPSATGPILGAAYCPRG